MIHQSKIYINLNLQICSIFAKAHELACGYADQNGKKCNGVPKLGELTQVR